MTRQTFFEFAIEYRTIIESESNPLKIAKGQVALLGALIAASDNVGTLDDATAELSEAFDDDGKWRGAICLGLWKDGFIEHAGAENSRRRSRNRGLLRRWRLVDRARAQKKISALLRMIERLEKSRTIDDSKGVKNDPV